MASGQVQLASWLNKFGGTRAPGSFFGGFRTPARCQRGFISRGQDLEPFTSGHFAGGQEDRGLKPHGLPQRRLADLGYAVEIKPLAATA